VFVSRCCQNVAVSEATHRSHDPATQRVHQPGHGEALAHADEHPVEHERPEDWGWHGETGKWGRAGAWIAVLVTLTFLIGNHEGRIEDAWVLGIAAIMVLVLIWDIRRRKNAWRSR
jgi:hypothetical protein